MSTITPPIDTVRDSELRELAVERLKKKQDFRGHLLVYVLVNAVIWTIWATTGAGFPWPVLIAAGWGIGVVMNAWDVYWRKPLTERDIEQELERLRRG